MFERVVKFPDPASVNPDKITVLAGAENEEPKELGFSFKKEWPIWLICYERDSDNSNLKIGMRREEAQALIRTLIEALHHDMEING